MPRSLFHRITATAFVIVLSALVGRVSGSDGLTPEESLKHFHHAEEISIELVAAEPQVIDPVAIAWDERGRLFVVEMRDYPNGPGEGKPFLSRIKLLKDSDGDGRYETASVFADELPFANGVLPWQGGLIVTAAPDIWFLKDTDGDGKADSKEKLFTGFKEGNPQLRVNHPTIGLDNWIYVANGLSGGEVERADRDDGRKIPIPQMDFRFRPDRSEYEATTGNAQFGLAFDDAGNRFYCSNRNHIVHVVFPDRYLKRNAQLGASKTAVDVPDHGAAARIFPLTRAVTTAVEHAGSFTAACGLVVYRGTALPPEYRGNSFVCDPTGNLVHRDVLEPSGATFVAKRAEAESRREFLASTDEWFRPVNLANGPDGALYLVDMYRGTIEHPQYMPKGLAETLDLRQGDDRGRIYRIKGKGPQSKTGRWPAELDSNQLVELLRSPEAWWRETAQRLLLERQASDAAPALAALAREHDSVATIHALWTLDGLGKLTDELIRAAFDSPHATVREHALKLVEPRLKANTADLADAVVRLAGDADPRVRFQTALALGEFSADDPKIKTQKLAALGRIIHQDIDDAWTQLAVLSSISGEAAALWQQVADQFAKSPSESRTTFVTRLAQLIGARRDDSELAIFIGTFAERQSAGDVWWQLAAIRGLADGLRPSGKSLADVVATTPHADRAGARIEQLLADAHRIALEANRPVAERTAAIALLSNSPLEKVRGTLIELLAFQQPQEVQVGAVRAASAIPDAEVARMLLDGWPAHSPPLRREILEAVFSRRDRLPHLLDSIAAGVIKAADLDTQRHTQLLNHPTKEIKERAAKLFADQGTPNRKDVIESYRTVLSQAGDVARGKEIFRKNCAGCHRAQGEGHLVGPELSGMRTRSKEAILMDVLDPNRALNPNYANYLVATKDGRVLSGLIASETANSITLRRAEGAEDTLLRSDLEAIRATGQSLMPEGLERQVNQSEMVDLVEFLKTLP